MGIFRICKNTHKLGVFIGNAGNTRGVLQLGNNLAKVGVESSNLFARSNISAKRVLWLLATCGGPFVGDCEDA